MTSTYIAVYRLVIAFHKYRRHNVLSLILPMLSCMVLMSAFPAFCNKKPSGITLPDVPASVKTCCDSELPVEGATPRIHLVSRKILPEDRLAFNLDLLVQSKKEVMLPLAHWFDYLVVEAFNQDGSSIGSWWKLNTEGMGEIKQGCDSLVKDNLLIDIPLAENAVTDQVIIRVSVVYSGFTGTVQRSKYTKEFKVMIIRLTDQETKELIKRDYEKAYRHPTRKRLEKLLRHTSSFAQECALRLAKEKTDVLSQKDFAFILLNVAPFADDTRNAQVIELASDRGDDNLLFALSNYIFSKRTDAAMRFAINQMIGKRTIFSSWDLCFDYIAKYADAHDLLELTTILETKELPDIERQRVADVIARVKGRLEVDNKLR